MIAGLQRFASRYEAFLALLRPSPMVCRKGLFVVHRAMVVHESWMMREILKVQLADSNCHVVYSASSRLEAQISYRLHKPDIVFVDATQNVNRGHHIIQDLVDLDPMAAVVAMVNPDGDTAALHALVHGARGFMTISSSSSVIQQEIKRILEDKPQCPTLAKTMEQQVAGRFRFVLRRLAGWRGWARRDATESR